MSRFRLAGAPRRAWSWTARAGRQHPWEFGAGAAAVVVAIAYVIQVYQVSDRFGFPLDDSYIYMTYAKQIGRLQPFSYFDGSGYSAGSTSVLWPFVLAPAWMLGLRGELFVFGSFAICALLMAATAAMAFRVARRVFPDDNKSGVLAGVGATLLVVTSPALTWSSLAGMEVALATALIFLSALLLMRNGDMGKPTRLVVIVLSLTTLSRPEAGLLVVAICGLKILSALRQRAWRVCAIWSIPIFVPLLVAVINKSLAGYFTPNTAIAKSHFYLPGFDWTYYFDTLREQTVAFMRGVFSSSSSPLGIPRLMGCLWLVGAIRILYWGRKNRQIHASLLVLLAPFAIFAGVLVASGQWDFQNYRYITTGFPALFVGASVGFATIVKAVLARATRRRRQYSIAITSVVAVVISATTWSELRKDMLLFAQGVRDSNAQVVKIGKWIDQNLPPDAYVAYHDAGAIAYYGERRFLDIIGLITNGQAEVCNHGPGTRFEALEHLDPADRPSYFAYYAGWLIAGSRDLYGKTLFETPLPKRLLPNKQRRRLVGGGNMRVFEANWTIINSGHVPQDMPAGWRVVGRLDVADLDSESAHAFSADLPRRRFRDGTGRWSVYLSSKNAATGTVVADGGRTTRAKGTQRFTMTVPAGAQSRLIIRVGDPKYGAPTLARARGLRVVVAGMPTQEVALPTRRGQLHDISIALPPRKEPATLQVSVRSQTGAPFRTFHYFVIQSAE